MSDEIRQNQKRVHQGYSQGRTVRNEDEGGQAEVVWTCHEERPRVCRKKDDESGVTGKEKRETKEKICRCSKRRYVEVGVKETGVEDRKVWRMMIRCGHP